MIVKINIIHTFDFLKNGLKSEMSSLSFDNF